MQRIKFEIKQADLQRVFHRAIKVTKELVDYTMEQIEKQLNEYMNELIEFIDQQRGNWAPLSEGWVKFKASHGLDPRILISKGDYIKSIKVVRNGDTFAITAEGNEKLAEYLEFGTQHMPARPHWAHINIQIKYQMASSILRLVRKKALELSK